MDKSLCRYLAEASIIGGDLRLFASADDLKAWRPRADVLVFREEVLDDESVEILWVTEDLHRRGVELLQPRLDKTYSLCDAVSFVLMRDPNWSRRIRHSCLRRLRY